MELTEGGLRKSGRAGLGIFDFIWSFDIGIVKSVFVELSSTTMRGELLEYDGMGEGVRSDIDMLGD